MSLTTPAIFVDIAHFASHEFKPPVSSPISSPALPLPSGTSFKTSKAHMYGAMARAIGYKASPAAYAAHKDALEMLFGAFLDFNSSKLSVDFQGYTGLPLIDFISKGFTGLIGYGLSILASLENNYLWFSHYEELRDRLVPGGDFKPARTPQPGVRGKIRSLNRRPDLIGVKFNREVGIIECKGTLSDDLSKPWKTLVFEAFMEQADPFLGTTLGSMIVEEVNVYCGQLLESAQSGTARMFSRLPSSSRRSSYSSLMRPIILPHYQKWLKLMGSDFWGISDGLIIPSGSVRPPIRIFPSPNGSEYQSFITSAAPDQSRSYIFGMTEQVYDFLESIPNLGLAKITRYSEHLEDFEEFYDFDDSNVGELIVEELPVRSGRGQDGNDLLNLFSELTGGSLFPDGTLLVSREYYEQNLETTLVRQADG